MDFSKYHLKNLCAEEMIVKLSELVSECGIIYKDTKLFNKPKSLARDEFGFSQSEIF